MAQEGDTATWDLKPWAGTFEQLKSAARICAARVAEAAPYPEDHDPENVRYGSKSYDADSARKITILVVEDEGFQRTLNAIDDLDEIRADHLTQVGLVDITIGSVGTSPCSASISVSRRNGLEVRLRGRNRTWTAGLKHEVQEALTPGARLALPGLTDKTAVSLATAAVALALAAGDIYVLVEHHSADWASWALTGFVIAMVATQFLGFVVLKLPTMELLTSGQQPTYQRWRKRIFAVFGALAIGVVGSIIAAVIWP
jgi:hypothetical protein